jgi:hypothetical protein
MQTGEAAGIPADDAKWQRDFPCLSAVHEGGLHPDSVAVPEACLQPAFLPSCAP